jgi:2,4-dienoyl-CoA reductase-like NADH-dependent reductase (Old Yellow Enzyme family)
VQLAWARQDVKECEIIAAGGFELDTAETTVENDVADAVAFGPSP